MPSKFMNENRFEHSCHNGCVFTADRCDFQNGVIVRAPDDLSETGLAQDVSEMIGYHAVAILPELNGFNGCNLIRYRIIRNKKAEKIPKKPGKIIVTACEQHWGEVARLLLETPGWPHGEIEAMTGYDRYDDDTQKGHIVVSFSPDSDAWLQIFSHKDPDEMSLSHRFRMPLYGGGQSARTRQALVLLALAIKLDNEKAPQTRRK